jgi:hypothetical protein
VRLLSLDLSLLQAGAGVKGEFERRLHGVVDAVKSIPANRSSCSSTRRMVSSAQAGRPDRAMRPTF